MSLVNYDPFYGVRQLQDDINRLFTSWNTTDRHGVLEILIPKQAKAQPRRIEVAA